MRELASGILGLSDAVSVVYERSALIVRYVHEATGIHPTDMLRLIAEQVSLVGGSVLSYRDDGKESEVQISTSPVTWNDLS